MDGKIGNIRHIKETTLKLYSDRLDIPVEYVRNFYNERIAILNMLITDLAREEKINFLKITDLGATGENEMKILKERVEYIEAMLEAESGTEQYMIDRYMLEMGLDLSASIGDLGKSTGIQEEIDGMKDPGKYLGDVRTERYTGRIKNLTAEMEAAGEAGDYESAISYREDINRLKKMLE